MSNAPEIIILRNLFGIDTTPDTPISHAQAYTRIAGNPAVVEHVMEHCKKRGFDFPHDQMRCLLEYWLNDEDGLKDEKTHQLPKTAGEWLKQLDDISPVTLNSYAHNERLRPGSMGRKKEPQEPAPAHTRRLGAVRAIHNGVAALTAAGLFAAGIYGCSKKEEHLPDIKTPSPPAQKPEPPEFRAATPPAEVTVRLPSHISLEELRVEREKARLEKLRQEQGAGKISR